MTLIELLIALVVMTIISVSILGSLTTLSTASKNQRGIANVDAAALTYAEAIKHHVNFTTTLTGSGITTATQTSFTVADASELTAPVEVVVGGELMEVQAVSGNTLSNVVRGDRGTTAWTYAAGTTISPAYTPCPMAAQLAPVNYTAPTNVNSVGIAGVEYWLPSTQTFTSSRNSCVSAFQTLCPSYTSDGSTWANTFQSDNLPQCDPGVQRVTITVVGDTTTGNATTSTEVLVRRGSG